jgi:hypothetical protein
VRLWESYRGSSLIRKTPSWDPAVGPNLGSYGGPRWGGLFLMSEVPLQVCRGNLVCPRLRPRLGW